MTTRAWTHHIARTTILSATLAALCQAQEAVTRQAVAQTAAPDFTQTTLNSLGSISEDQSFISPDVISSVVGSFYTDPDSGQTTGVAIIGADTANGTWEYTPDINVSNWIPFGSVSPTHALLLDFVMFAYGNSGVRFVPNTDFNGNLPTALTLLAWDESNGLSPSGLSPSYGNTTVRGSTSAYGVTQATTDLTVFAVQDAPRLDNSGNPHLSQVAFGTPGDPGTRIDVMLATGAGGAPIIDPDAGALTGIAIIGVDTTYGNWEYTVNGAANWTAMPAVSATNALLLNVSAGPYTVSTDVRVRFVQSASAFSGTISNALTFRAWDQSDFASAGAQTDPTFNIGGSGSISVNVETASIDVTGVAPVVAPVVFPEPPVSSGGETVYGAVSPGTPEGLVSLMSALNGKPSSEVRAFAWDAVTQSFAEYPAQPTGGLRPDSGIFLATRSALPVDFAGSIAGMPYVLTIRPGWNLLGVPPLDNSGSVTLSHPWDDFELVDETSTPVIDPVVFTNILGTPAGAISTARPWAWDGSGYAQVTTLDTGTAYWIKNNTSNTMTLLRTASSQLPNPRRIGGATRVSGGAHGVIVDRGTPPRPPLSAAAPSGRCGAGSAIAVLALGFLGLLRGRRQR